MILLAKITVEIEMLTTNIAVLALRISTDKTEKNVENYSLV